LSGNLHEKIKWYIKAHGHSSIGGLNILLIYFSNCANKNAITIIEKLIFDLENYSTNVAEHYGSLEKGLLHLEKLITQIELEDHTLHEMKGILEGVRENLERIQKIIDTPGYMEDLNIFDIFNSALSELLKRYPEVLYGDVIGKMNMDAGSKIEIKWIMDCEDKLIKVCGYEIQLLFYNLISNAIDAILPDNGCISIEISFEEKNVILVIKDDGELISDENINNINNRVLFTTKGTKHGSGMKIIYDIVDKYHGLILTSNEEKTTITIKIPI